MANDPEFQGERCMGTYASPPCFMHEVDPAYGGIVADAEQARDVARWRKAERERLIAARLALPLATRTEHVRLIARDLDRLVPREPGAIVSLYWPFRGEPDLRGWMHDAYAAGLRLALPLVAAKAQPLVFREWRPGAPLESGVWGIPYPRDGAVITPRVVIAPLVGFDPSCYRLGYGGGFFDRTVAAMAVAPLVVGVGHPMQRVSTIYPQPHDIPMSWIVTGLEAPVRALQCDQRSG